jgi:hypothetical protein
MRYLISKTGFQIFNQVKDQDESSGTRQIEVGPSQLIGIA